MKPPTKQLNIYTKTTKNTWYGTKVALLGHRRYKPYLNPE
jgi:hypothetical protein